MGNTRTMKEPEFTLIDEGTYPVTCIGVRGDTLEKPLYGDGAVIKFSLEFDGLEDDEGEPLTREAMASDYLTTGSKLTRYLFAFGISAGVGQDVDLDDAIGKQALAVVGKKTKGDKVYDTIDNLIPAPKTRGNGAKPAQAASKPSQTPAMITALGEVDWTIFWAECGKAGIQKTEVAEELGGDLTLLPNVPAADVVKLFEKLRDKHEGVADPDDVPFEG